MDFRVYIKPIQTNMKQLPHPPYVKDFDLDVHIRMFKTTIIINGEVIECDIYQFISVCTLQDNIFEWGMPLNYHLPTFFDFLRQT